MRVWLEDQNGDAPRRQVFIAIEGGQLCIRPIGYGDKTSKDGEGYPIVIEVLDDVLRVAVWPDSNNEEPQVIEMEGARECLRKN